MRCATSSLTISVRQGPASTWQWRHAWLHLRPTLTCSVCNRPRPSTNPCAAIFSSKRFIYAAVVGTQNPEAIATVGSRLRTQRASWTHELFRDSERQRDHTALRSGCQRSMPQRQVFRKCHQRFSHYLPPLYQSPSERFAMPYETRKPLPPSHGQSQGDFQRTTERLTGQESGSLRHCRGEKARKSK